MKKYLSKVATIGGVIWSLLSINSAACVTLDSVPIQNVANDEKLINLNESLTLCPTEEVVYGTRFKVKASNIVLDCGGNTFDGMLSAPENYVSRALDSMSSLENVVIKNCKFKNYQSGLILAPSTLGISGANYITGLKKFTISNVTIENTEGGDDGNGEGVIVGPYSQDFLIENTLIKDTKLSGLYLEANSIRTKVVDSYFLHNGFSGGTEGREAIAIDASSGNVISGNTFVDNKYAAITTYKNCGESNTYRAMHANNNIIEDNVFKYHDNHDAGAAIIIASRQGKTISGCSDETIGGYIDKYFDYSKFNVIRNNAFINNITSIKLMDSFQTVIGNTFHGTTWTDLNDSGIEHNSVYDLAIGNAILSDFNSPVIGISVLNNVTRTSTTNASGRTFVSNHSSVAHFSGNTDAYYRCLSDSKAPGNTCSQVLGLSNRCEISATSCPARSSYPNAQEFPSKWFDTTYGSNVSQDICAARAKDLWQWCDDESSSTFFVTSKFVKNNYLQEETVYGGS
ncbi:right-handed parallel beta-helix repeat-containing protein [Microbulbifer variabilis]|uniref:Right-handed parallel beta-helix repeat-containing protein n=1 Tax=Microbulbifer variabilis TaxID=266805 RepID=A0ABY4V6S5_9GAMM|nr:right-handed parallel beta-helix repeat-containing protein [Microbulbifer variabilis]USD19969.1 right-handed parallel beta-helix repeat-containing protein [Microbulbifer variabilis]